MKVWFLIAVLVGHQHVLAQTTGIDHLLGELEGAVVAPSKTNKLRSQRVVTKGLRSRRRSDVRRLAEESRRIGKDWRYRCAVMRIAADIQDVTVTSALVGNLKKGEDMNLRVCAAQQLRIHKNPETLFPLLDALSENNGKLRASAASALGALRDKRALAKLSKTIFDEDRSTAINSIWAVGEIADEAGLAPLLEAMPAMDETKKINLVSALGKIGGVRARQELVLMRASADALTVELIDETIKTMQSEKP